MAQDTGHAGLPTSSSEVTLNSGAGESGEGLLPVGAPLTLDVSGTPIVLRPERQQDEAFLAVLFRTVVWRELALVPGDDLMKDALLRLQFASQAATYRGQFPAARFDIMEQGGVPIGRIVIDPGTTAGRIVDFALMPERRARGLGTVILSAVLERFERRRQHVLCQVLAGNEASLRMCRRAGFQQIGCVPPFRQLEWRPRDAREATMHSTAADNAIEIDPERK